MATHKHHIIPKHMGGSNDPSNLIELSVEEHAEAHRTLYEQYGYWQDYMAWRALSGQISKDDIRRELTRNTWIGRKHSEETKEKIRTARANQSTLVHSAASKEKTSKTLLGHAVSAETRAKISLARKGKVDREFASKNFSQRSTCVHCGKESNLGMIARWHNDNCRNKR